MAGKVTKNVMYTPWRVVQLCPDLRMIQWWYRRTRADNRDDSILLSRDRRVRARRDDVRLGPRLLPGAARERRNPDPPRADARGAEGHRVRLGARQGDGPARRRPVGRRQGAGRLWPSRPSRGPTAASSAPASSAGPAAGRSSRSPSPSRTCGSTSRPIGVTTIENLHKAGASVLAIEAGKTIVIDQPEVVALADRYGLSIVAMLPGVGRRPAAPATHN